MKHIGLLLLLLPAAIYANELRVPYGAGSAALGGAVTALPRTDAVFLNPSLIALMEQKQLLISGTHSFEDRETFQALGIVPKNKFGVAAGFSRTTVANVPLRDELNRDLGSSDYFSQKINLAAAMPCGESLSVGLGLNVSGLGLGDDVFETKTLADLGLAAGVNNWNIGLSLLGWGDRNSSEARIGVARQGKIVCAVDGIWKSENGFNAAFSVETKVTDHFFLLGAYHSRFDENKSFGLISKFGFGFRFEHKALNLEYAFVPERDLGFSHKFAVTLKGKKRAPSSSTR